jgi:outer membrane lipoprotein-sorting protein
MHALVAFAFLLAADSPAPPGTWHQDLASIRKAAATLTTLEASFVQTRTLKILKKPLISRGVIAYRRPNDLRWEYQSPLAMLLVVRKGNAQRLLKHGAEWVTDHSAKLEAMKFVLDEINLWLEGNFSASKAFRAELRPATKEQPAHVALSPLDPALGKIVSRIAITFGEQPGTVGAIDIFEQGEGVTHIAFENSRYNEAVPDERFETPR